MNCSFNICESHHQVYDFVQILISIWLVLLNCFWSVTKMDEFIISSNEKRRTAEIDDVVWQQPNVPHDDDDLSQLISGLHKMRVVFVSKSIPSCLYQTIDSIHCFQVRYWPIWDGSARDTGCSHELQTSVQLVRFRHETQKELSNPDLVEKVVNSTSKSDPHPRLPLPQKIDKLKNGKT